MNNSYNDGFSTYTICIVTPNKTVPMTNHIDILLVDDDQDDLYIISTMISAMNPSFTLLAMTDGKHAMAYLASLPDNGLPHLLIVDFNMPHMSGVEMLGHLLQSERYKQMVRVVLSTYGSPTDIKRCINSGAAGYFCKGGSLAEIKSVIDDILCLYDKVHCNAIPF